ncbi:syntaxin binding protein 1, partial [Spiromyces aspiralis]
LLIVDRSIDSLAPLLHEFTYQAMVYDLIPIENGNAYTHVTETGERRKYVLDYNDEVWAKYRYMHISDAQLKLKEEFDQFIQTNRAIVNARNAAPGDINQLKQAMVDMPEAQKKLRLFTLHIDLMRRCMQEFTQQGLEELAAIEQNLATGTTEDGSRYESANVDLPILLRNISSRPQKSTNALRLLLIYMLANKIDQAEILQLAKHFNLGMPAVGIINNLKYLMSRSRVMDLIEILRRRRETSAASKFSFAKILSLNKQAQDDNDDDDVSYDLSRYVPIAKVLLERCIRGGIDDKLFPYISAPAATATSAAAAMPPSASSLPSSGAGPTAQQRPQSNSSSMWNSLLTSISGSQTPSRESETSPSVMARGSLRSTKPTWQKRTSPGPNSSAHSAVQTTTSIPSVTGPRAAPSRESAGMSERITTPRPPRVIIFVVGGVTFSEIRAAHEISQKYECEVLVGSTHLLTPAEYLDGVSTLDHQSVRLPTGEVADTADSYRLLGYPCPEG